MLKIHTISQTKNPRDDHSRAKTSAAYQCPVTLAPMSDSKKRPEAATSDRTRDPILVVIATCFMAAGQEFSYGFKQVIHKIIHQVELESL